jgi:TonB-linked SusC/RagA family outer membrane protein
MWAFRRFFPTDQLDELFAGGTSQQDLSGNSSHAGRLNFFGRANYNYQEKYLLELIARYDGSYIFPEGDRFGFFPSVSAGWRLAQEDWFNAFSGDVFDRLKLRASYGQVGNDQIEPYQFLRTFGFSGQFAFGDELGPRISQTRVPNPDITWEVATKLDVGLQGTVLGERLSFDLTYFQESRKDILWFRSEAVPETAGFSLPRENIGEVKSQGFEGQVSYSHEVSSDVTLRGSANLTYAKDEIEFFAEPEGVPEWQKNEGRPMNTELYYIADGVWSTQQEIDNAEAVWPGARPGDIRFKDLNGDGEITGDDRRRIEENGRPDLTGSFNLGATVGHFDARLLFQGAAQVKQHVFSTNVGTFGNWFQKFAERRWTPDNKDASGPRAYQRTEPYWASNQNTYFLRDAKYLRLKSARLGYRLPANWTEQVGAGQLQLYLSGRNLFTLTPLDIMDPEIRHSAARTYPPERAYTVGIQMSF